MWSRPPGDPRREVFRTRKPSSWRVRLPLPIRRRGDASRSPFLARTSEMRAPRRRAGCSRARVARTRGRRSPRRSRRRPIARRSGPLAQEAVSRRHVVKSGDRQDCEKVGACRHRDGTERLREELPEGRERLHVSEGLALAAVLTTSSTRLARGPTAHWTFRVRSRPTTRRCSWGFSSGSNTTSAVTVWTWPRVTTCSPTFRSSGPGATDRRSRSA
jgi:hypothetical protein